MATYFGGSWGRKDDYKGGKGAGTQVNTQWRRYGGLGYLDWQINEANDLQLMVRSDGIYDVGFRGSGANRYAKDDRINQSLDLTWNFDPAELPFKWTLHNYLVYDEDYFKWASPKANPGTSKDYNKRKLYIMGLKFQPVISLGDTNELMLGVDLEHSKLRSDRDRFGLSGNALPVNPQDLNQTEKVFAFYAEDTQRLFSGRLTLRAGLRYTRGETSIDSTPNEVTYGNKDIKPESSQQYEFGMFLHGQGWYTDLAVYHNEIKDRIVSRRLSSTESMYVNNPGKIIVSGLELDTRVNIDELSDLGAWRLAFGLNGSYNFKMKDEARSTRNRDKVDRMYEYQGTIYTQFGQGGEEAVIPWSVRLTGILRGPVFYDTEEGRGSPLLCPVPAGWPSPSEDYVEDVLDLHQLMVKNPPATYFLRATGHSMIGAGIHDGDLLVVDRSKEPKAGRVVIAAVDGELTIKRLLKKNGRVLLAAENPDYPDFDISGREDASIWGVVIYVIHSL